MPTEGSGESPILLTRKSRRTHPHTPTLPGIAEPPAPPLEALRAATDRDEIAGLVLSYFAHVTARTALFVLKKGRLVAQSAADDAAPRIEVPIDAPSIFRDVTTSRLPYHGPLPETPTNHAIAEALGGIRGNVILMPIAIRDRVIGLIYGEDYGRPLPDAALHAVCREAGLAYERLILRGKTGR
jgi:hypothetical protein